MKQIIIDIKKCTPCPHLDHTGTFTKGGAKPCCNHPEILKLKGMDCFERVIPNKLVKSFPLDPESIVGYWKVKKIPKWCPLPDKVELTYPPKGILDSNIFDTKMEKREKRGG